MKPHGGDSSERTQRKKKENWRIKQGSDKKRKTENEPNEEMERTQHRQ